MTTKQIINATPYKWIVSDPDLLGGQPAIVGTRLSVSHILACLAEGMTSEQIAVDYLGYPVEATPEVLKIASEKLESMWLLDHNLPIQLRILLKEFEIPVETTSARGWEDHPAGIGFLSTNISRRVGENQDCSIARQTH